MPPDDPRIGRARGLRREATPAESLLWRAIRNRQLDGFKFRRQAPIDRYFADLVCDEARVVVELDGGQHAEAEAYDDARTEVLEQAGYRVLRFWNHNVTAELDNVLSEISAVLDLAKP